MSNITATPSLPSSKEIAQFLRDPQSYSEQIEAVEVIETHISWVFLTGGYAYKLKKPVRFDFLDLSTPEARCRACHDELRLNRRMAPGVYLSVLPVRVSATGAVQLGGEGREVDYVVQMRQLDRRQALDRLIHERCLADRELDAVANFLANYYAKLSGKPIRSAAFHKHIVDHCCQNANDLLQHLDSAYHAQIKRVHGRQKRYLTLMAPLFHERVVEGRVVDGHGDLRAEHVYLEQTPVVIDCVEFSEEFREIDTVDELCFLALDAERLGNTELGSRLFAKYEAASGDRSPNSLRAFYKCYRACVRGKVAALRAQQESAVDCQPFRRQLHQYLAWADHYAEELGPPALIVIGGLMGTGKSTLAKGLAESMGAEHIRSDSVRRTVFGSSRAPAEYGEGIYRPEVRQHVYEQMFQEAEDTLDEGRTVILDGAFLTNDLRASAVAIGRKHGAATVFVSCKCAKETALARIAARTALQQDDSEARPDLYDQQLSEFEAVDPQFPTVCVDTESSLADELEAVYHQLRTRLKPTLAR